MAQGGVEAATGVGSKGGEAYRRVAVAAISKTPNDRMRTEGCVLVAGNVGRESPKTDGRVPEAASVVTERKRTDGRVVGAVGVASERISTVGRIVVTGGVARERTNDLWPCCRSPVVLAPRANAPLAVL